MKESEVFYLNEDYKFISFTNAGVRLFFFFKLFFLNQINRTAVRRKLTPQYMSSTDISNPFL